MNLHSIRTGASLQRICISEIFFFRSEESFEERIAEIARDRDDRISPETLCEMCAISGYLCYKNVDSLSLNGQSEAPPQV